MRRVRGFTLIELMIVVTIVAIIAAVAIPAFTKQIRRSHRAEAAKSLSDLQLRQERWRASNATYASGLATLLGSSAAATSYNSGSTYYSYTVTNAVTSTATCTCTTASCYKLTAAAKGAQTADTDCSSLVLTNTCGNIAKTPTTNRCWN